MTSPRYLFPKASHTRVANQLYVQKIPYASNSPSPSSLKAWKVNPITKNTGQRHKAKQPYHRRIR